MDRRSFLSLGARNHKKESNVNRTAITVATTTLEPYTGSWGIPEAKFLLQRTTFGPTPAQIKQAVEDGLSTTIGALFAERPDPELPIHYSYSQDSNEPGESWVNLIPPNPYPGGLNGARRRSVRAWILGRMTEGGVSIKDKMWLFWSNHFATSGNPQGQEMYGYAQTVYDNCLGNFRTLAEEISINPLMLSFLNGNKNTRNAPNENYARELLELFTIGRGPAAGPGDYTNYTEDDVIELAKALTGWTSSRVSDTSFATQGTFRNNRHDQGEKQLSHRFNNVVISNEGNQEYKTVIDLILQQEETARFLCRQLHLWFIGSYIDPLTEENIIEPMAQIIRDNDYEIQPAIEALINSEYFFQEAHRGCMVANPVDFTFRMFNTFNGHNTNASLSSKYRMWYQLDNLIKFRDMDIFKKPSVAGWNAYYQEPLYYKSWISAVTLPKYQGLANNMVNSGYRFQGYNFKLDFLGFIAEIDGAEDPNVLLAGIAQFLFNEPMSEEQITHLKELLIPGLPDYEWTVEYTDYLADPENQDLRSGINNQLKSVFSTIFKMPEFYMI